MANDDDAQESPEALEVERKRLRRGCRLLHGGEQEANFAELKRIAEWCEANDVEADRYGDGDGLQAFEQRVAEMLGYPAARFLPSGTMAQQIALRIWADEGASQVVGLHPTSHLLLHEENGYQRLHGLAAVLVGDRDRPMTTADLDSVVEPISALVVELPTRENGGQLTDWPDLLALSSEARQRGIALHLDGARLWEASAGYDRPLAEICELFDSTYVSFYKGIGALPGSVLAGPTNFVAQTKIWQRRHGGNLFTQMANWVSADMRLDRQLAKMPAFRDRAIELAAALNPIDGLAFNPAVPQVNMFHIFLSGDKDDLLHRRDQVARARGIWLFGGLGPTDVPNRWMFELAIGDAAMNLQLDEIVAAFTSFFDEPEGPASSS